MMIRCDLCNAILNITEDRRMSREELAQHLLEVHEDEAFELVTEGVDDYFTLPDEDDEVE